MDGRAAGNAEVGAVVKLSDASDGVHPHPVRRGHRAADRPAKAAVADAGRRGWGLAAWVDQPEAPATQQLERVEVGVFDEPAQMQAGSRAVTRRTQQDADRLPGPYGVADLHPRPY